MLVAPVDRSQVVMLLVVVFFVMIVHRYPYLGAACDCDSCDVDSANARLDGNSSHRPALASGPVLEAA